MRNRLCIHTFVLVLFLITAASSCASTPQQTRSSAPEQMFVIPLQFASADELAPELRGMLRAPLDPNRAEAACNVLVDSRTNSLIVCLPAGANTTEADVRKIVSSLDVKVTR